ncbi:MAG TPA: hydrogenase maturation nickel metallochaperone HypA [Anaerolineae bacterium]
MHELPVTQGILDVALEAAGKAGAPRITAINLVVGTLSSIVDDSVQFYFEILSKGTAAEGATLHFERESATATCLDCGRTFAVDALPLLTACRDCGSQRLSLTGGKSFFVESIEVDEREAGG